MVFHRILFPIDFSEETRAVAPFVHSMAQRYKAAVVLMNVVQTPPPPFVEMDGIYPPFDYEAIRAAVLRHLGQFATAELPRLDVTSVIEIGDPASAITEYAHGSADNNGVDLICMATRGHGAFRRALLGSVAAKVLHDAAVPVWMSAHAPEASHRAHPQPRHVLAAIDPEDGAGETLAAAAAIAREAGATLDVATAASAGVIAPGVADPQLDELLVEGTRELLAKLLFEAGIEAGLVLGEQQKSFGKLRSKSEPIWLCAAGAGMEFACTTTATRLFARLPALY